MQQRFDINQEEPGSFKAIFGMEHYVQTSGLEKRYLYLIKLRASQINGCAYCVDMHTKEARKAGFSDQWIALTSVWWESSVYDASERAVLNWTESLTKVSETRIPDADFEQLSAFFSNSDIAKLSVAVSTINVWNRMALALRLQHPVDAVGEAARATG